MMNQHCYLYLNNHTRLVMVISKQRLATKITSVIYCNSFYFYSFLQLLLALKALRDAGIIHADIKPSNVMLVNQKDQPFKVKLIDFGQAMTFVRAQQAQGVKIQTMYYR